MNAVDEYRKAKEDFVACWGNDVLALADEGLSELADDAIAELEERLTLEVGRLRRKLDDAYSRAAR